MDPVTNRGSLPVAPECEPSPAPPADDDVPTNDLGATLLALVMRSLNGSSTQAMADIEHANELIERARAEVEAAMRRAEEAEESAGFWGSLRQVLGGELATLASVVAAAAVLIGTGGVGAPAILALGAALLSTGATIGSRLGLDPKVCALLGTAAALVGVAMGGAGATGALAKLATGARVLQASATAASGGAMIVEGEFRSQSLDARADQKAAEQKEQGAQLDIELALQVLEELQRDVERSRRATSQVQATHDETHSAVIARIGAA